MVFMKPECCELVPLWEKNRNIVGKLAHAKVSAESARDTV